MKIVWRFPAVSELAERPPDIRRGADFIPRVGDRVDWPTEDGDGTVRSFAAYVVAGVTWYPLGDPASGEPERFVLVVLDWFR